MVGLLVREAVFTHIDSGDLSTEMLTIAARHCVYGRLFQLDMTIVTVSYPLMHMMR